MGHIERAHALLSASSAHRWLICTPSAKLEEQFPDTTSDAAKEGTLAHELAEKKVLHYFYTCDFGKRKLTNAIKKLRENELWQDEMLEHTDTYLYFLKSVAMALPVTPYVAIEKRVDFGTYVPDGFGTADCIMVQGDTLHVFDFKYGKGVPVSAEENPQMMLYALGAYEAYKMFYPIKQIHLAIVQPRLPDGTTEWSCSLSELLEFGEYVRGKAALATEGQGDFCPGEKQCGFCRARAQCRARSDYNVKQAFTIGELPPLIANEEVGERLSAMEDVVKYQKDLQEYALAQCLAGKEISGWKAVEGRGSREWTNADAALKKLTDSGIVEDAVLWEKKPLTLAQIEKIVGKKDFADSVGEYITKTSGKPTLAKESDRREAITNQVTAAEAFKEEN